MRVKPFHVIKEVWPGHGDKVKNQDKIFFRFRKRSVAMC